jgi:uncharacterized protein YlxP (DUF503 family)
MEEQIFPISVTNNAVTSNSVNVTVNLSPAELSIAVINHSDTVADNVLKDFNEFISVKATPKHPKGATT